jgi:methionyl-tRNA formyltransferase
MMLFILARACRDVFWGISSLLCFERTYTLTHSWVKSRKEEEEKKGSQREKKDAQREREREKKRKEKKQKMTIAATAKMMMKTTSCRYYSSRCCYYSSFSSSSSSPSCSRAAVAAAAAAVGSPPLGSQQQRHRQQRTAMRRIRRHDHDNKSINNRRTIKTRATEDDSNNNNNGSATKRVAFLGTPEVAAKVFERLHEASINSDGLFEIAAVISQPGRPRGRGRKSAGPPPPSPVTQSAIDRGVDESKLLNPVKANEPEFLETLTKMNLDLCVTAAYGNFLPQKFLDIPRLGTLNIHPSLLPQFRGAAPVQRCIESGLEETGVTVAFTVLKMDAGPILTQTKYKMNGSEKAHEMLDVLFDIGVDSLIEQLPKVFSGEAGEIAKDQGEEGLSHADKVSSEEGDMDFTELSALQAHNKVRAFDGWPGTKATFIIQDEKKGGEPKEIVVKILTTKVGDSVEGGEKVVKVAKKQFSIPCKDGRYLDVLEVQPPGKKPMDVASFVNGLKGSSVSLP